MEDDGLWLCVTFGFNVTVPILVKQLKGFLVFLNHVFCQIIGHVVVCAGTLCVVVVGRRVKPSPKKGAQSRSEDSDDADGGQSDTA